MRIGTRPKSNGGRQSGQSHLLSQVLGNWVPVLYLKSIRMHYGEKASWQCDALRNQGYWAFMWN